ncbi:hypothetical protein LZ32DRAFT_419581 [Colletotrichum eremochloae]|nr:hypothetical protein LZ32DRAFT_419581 [Colletotrichum eremochloae]
MSPRCELPRPSHSCTPITAAVEGERVRVSLCSISYHTNLVLSFLRVRTDKEQEHCPPTSSSASGAWRMFSDAALARWVEARTITNGLGARFDQYDYLLDQLRPFGLLRLERMPTLAGSLAMVDLPQLDREPTPTNRPVSNWSTGALPQRAWLKCQRRLQVEPYPFG